MKAKDKRGPVMELGHLKATLQHEPPENGSEDD